MEDSYAIRIDNKPLKEAEKAHWKFYYDDCELVGIAYATLAEVEKDVIAQYPEKVRQFIMFERV